jgi:hypothetical protein
VRVLVFISLLFISLCVALFSPLSEAKECKIRLNYGLLIAPDHIRILDSGRTQVQINNDSQLFIRGEWITLTDQERYLVEEFSQGLRKELPEIVNIAMDSLDLGFDALNLVIKGFAGTDAAQGIKDHFNQLRGALLKRFARSGNNFYIAPLGFNELDKFFTDELSSQVSSVVTESMSIMLNAMDDAYRQSEGDIEGQDINIETNIDRLSKDVEKTLANNANRLAIQAAAFCERFQTLDKIEIRLQNQIPQLQKYDILTNQI